MTGLVAAGAEGQAEEPRLRYVPAIDGLRALAVAAVFAYHAGIGWARGGFLGVDVFFVISGYLITALLLTDHRRTGKIRLLRFWRRRARRLLPALFLLLVGVSVAVPLLATDQGYRLRADVLAALGYVSNWRLIFEHQSYFQSLGRPPLLQHLWSLAVEEQFSLERKAGHLHEAGDPKLGSEGTNKPDYIRDDCYCIAAGSTRPKPTRCAPQYES